MRRSDLTVKTMEGWFPLVGLDRLVRWSKGWSYLVRTEFMRVGSV